MDLPTIMDLCSSITDLQPSIDDSGDKPRRRSPGKPSTFASSHTRCASCVANSCAVQWPAAAIPVEVFEIITSHLSRAEIKVLRLVCKEFEAKVSSQYFKNVVVPFRSELYSKLARDENGALVNPASRLFSNGARIFEDFGPHIRRFALSLELEEEALSFPPMKPAQEAVSAFWGVYRWPHENYHRYTDLEGLEQTADETEGMRAALRCLTKVSTLGLCCDAGLGFLCGPDQIARNNTIVHPVFQSYIGHRNRSARTKSAPILTLGEVNEAPKDDKGRPYRPIERCRLKVLERMVGDAGYTESQIDEAVDLLLDTEGETLNSIAFDERLPSAHFHQVERPGTQLGSNSTDTITSVTQVASAETKSYSLAPASLTRPQKEMLLELEWAHRAMIQSYVLGITDNATGGHFDNVTTLNIAKIPSSHTYILCRKSFWSALPNLNSVALGVIADWRRVSKTATNSVEDVNVTPVAATSNVFHLLSKYIGTQKNVESLHFEWICGGEFAPSSYQRNQYVLPAPFVEFPEMMATAAGSRIGTDKRLLRLPHVKHLSLKNCWFAPHILIQELRDFALGSLETLELESVSLSGPPVLSAMDAQAAQGFPPHLQGNQPANAAAVADPFAANQTILNMMDDTPGPNTAALDPSISAALVAPKWYSWVGIIDQFSPSTKVRLAMAAEGDDAFPQANDSDTTSIGSVLPDASRLRVEESYYKLRSLSFKSCGYVILDHPLFTMRNMLPATFLPHFANGGVQPRAELSPLMQQCKDRLLGRVVPFITPGEDTLLEDVFHMQMGWEGVYEPKIIEHAIADGVEHAGVGRFSGIVESSQRQAQDWATHLFDL